MENSALKLDIKKTIMVGLAFFTITMFWEVYDNIMPLFLHDFGIGGTMRGVVMALDNVLALVLLPFMGLMSDKFPTSLRAKFGRRIPFIVCGSILAAVTFMLLNFAHNANNLALMIVMTIFVLLFMCMYRTPAVSLMPDVTPKPIRSQGNTVINIMGTVGGVITLILMTFLLQKVKDGLTEDGLTAYRISGDNWALIIIICVLMVLAAVIMMFKVKENKLVEQKKELMHSLGIDEDENEDVKSNKDKVSTFKVLSGLSKGQFFSLFFILSSVFLWYMAYNGIKTHFSVFSLTVLGDEKFTLPLLIANAAAFAMFVPSSIIGKKIGRKHTVMIGVGLLIVGFALGSVIMLFSSPEIIKIAMYPVFLLVGAGWATINVHSYVMSVEMATEQTTGVFTGLYYTFAMSAQILTPIFAGLVMDLQPKLLVVYSFVFSCLALVTMLFVRHGNAMKLKTDNQNENKVD